MAKSGIRSLNGNQYYYSEGTSGESLAIGVDSSNGHIHLVVSPTPDADPTGNPIFDIESAVNGNIDITPNGSGVLNVSAQNITTSLQLGYLGAGTLVTDGSGNVSTGSVSSFTWNNVTGTTQLLAVNNGYFSTGGSGTVTFTLPATATFGDTIRVANPANGDGWVIAQNANQFIIFGNQVTTTGVGGSLASTADGDCVELVCYVGGASTVWQEMSSQGNITIV